MIFLGPVGFFISLFLMNLKPSHLALAICLLAVSFFAFGDFLMSILIWYVLSIGCGIFLLVISEERWNRQRHYYYDHEGDFMFGPKKGPEHCRTGLCRGEGPEDFRTP